MNTVIIGKRLAMLRDELARPREQGWTQGKVAKETGLTLNQVARLEQTGAGSIEAFVTLLAFYFHRGYNLSWIVLPDNSMCSKLLLNDSTKSLDAHTVFRKLEELKESLSGDVDAMIGHLRN